MDAEAHVDADPVNPMRIFSEFSPQAPRQRHRSPPTAARRPTGTPARSRCAAPCAASLSGTLATMGPAVPYAIGAKFAHPDRPAIAFEGDGAMQMNGLAELLTIARYWQRVGRPAARRRGAAQQRPQPGHLGAARDGRHAEVRRVAGAARHVVRRLRRLDRPRCALTVTDPEHLADAWRAGAGRRPAVRARRALRPRRAPDPAARDPRADDRHGRGADQGRHARGGA